MTSPQFTEHDEARAQNGTPFLLGGGLGLPAGGTLTVNLSGLPVHSPWPRRTALMTAALILFIGLWFAWSGASTVDNHKRLTDRRESLFGG